MKRYPAHSCGTQPVAKTSQNWFSSQTKYISKIHCYKTNCASLTKHSQSSQQKTTTFRALLFIESNGSENNRCQKTKLSKIIWQQVFSVHQQQTLSDVLKTKSCGSQHRLPIRTRKERKKMIEYKDDYFLNLETTKLVNFDYNCCVFVAGPNQERLTVRRGISIRQVLFFSSATLLLLICTAKLKSIL